MALILAVFLISYYCLIHIIDSIKLIQMLSSLILLLLKCFECYFSLGIMQSPCLFQSFHFILMHSSLGILEVIHAMIWEPLLYLPITEYYFDIQTIGLHSLIVVIINFSFLGIIWKEFWYQFIKDLKH